MKAQWVDNNIKKSMIASILICTLEGVSDDKAPDLSAVGFVPYCLQC